MSLNIIITGLFYLLPRNVEMYYCYALESRYIAKHVVNLDVIIDAVLDVIDKRNFLYIFGLSSLIVSFMPFKMLEFFTYCLFLYSIFVYFRSIKRWLPYIT
jgi:hypothetical protein